MQTKMKVSLRVLLAAGMLATLTIAFVSCSDDDGPSNLQLSALTAGSIDLNGATSPDNVPADAAFTATFNTDLDPATVTNDNVKLTREYDNTVMDVTLSPSGKTITITPDEALGSGTLYILSFGTGLQSSG
ncbi:MAG TPA: Ig-like domain-containing protein, partial [Cyclobacteriaceae bacterium]|nr:Ig-like domain-containing protein [Cyclobacteriaceae bacterium]